MERVTCAFCGLPFRVRRAPPGASHYCCSGCALASRIPVHGDRLPVSRGLVIALVLGFGLFNQFLFTALGAATAAEGREAEAEIFVLVANSLAGVLAIACIGFVVTTVPRRISDWTIVLAAVSAGVVIHWHGALSTATRTGWGWFIVNGALALWLVRGWFRRGWRRRQLRRAAKT